MFSKLKTIFKKTSKERRYFEKLETFISENPSNIWSKKQLYKVFGYYEKWISHGGVACKIYHRELLYYISVRCFWSNIDDSEFVGKIMRHFRKVDMNIMDFIFPGSERFPKPVRSDCAMHVAEFFLRHANQTRFAIHLVRMADLLVNRSRQISQHPCEIALLAKSPEVLLVLFRYGALTSGSNYFAKIYILKLVKHFIRIVLDLRTASGSSNFNRRVCRDFPIIHCGIIIMRVCPQLSQISAFEPSSRYLPSIVNSRKCWEWIINNCLPELEYRIFQPMSLKQISKLKVREVLHENWLLPDGIERLEIPKDLKNYLDLWCD